MTKGEFIISKIGKNQPMSEICDIEVVYDLFAYLKPKNILELGVGGGEWIITINSLFEYPINFVGYESFLLNYGKEWPTNAADLDAKIRNNTRDIKLEIREENVISIDTDLLKSNNIIFDVVRLDCLNFSQTEISELFYKILPYTSAKCLFLVDDITPNLCPNRFLSYMEHVEKGLLKPLWFGVKEGCWCKHVDTLALEEFLIEKFGQNFYNGAKLNTEFYKKKYPLIRTWEK